MSARKRVCVWAAINLTPGRSVLVARRRLVWRQYLFQLIRLSSVRGLICKATKPREAIWTASKDTDAQHGQQAPGLCETLLPPAILKW